MFGWLTNLNAATMPPLFVPSPAMTKNNSETPAEQRICYQKQVNPTGTRYLATSKELRCEALEVAAELAPIGTPSPPTDAQALRAIQDFVTANKPLFKAANSSCSSCSSSSSSW